MWRQVFAPIYPDGWKFVAIAAVVTLVLFLLWSPAGWVGVIATLVDGVFLSRSVARDADPAGADRQPGGRHRRRDRRRRRRRRNSTWAPRRCRASAFFSTCSTCMSRARRSAAGSRRGAIRRGCSSTPASTRRAATTSASRSASRARWTGGRGPDIAFVLIAGLVARRIVCPVYEGQLLGRRRADRHHPLRLARRYLLPAALSAAGRRRTAHDRRRNRARRPQHGRAERGGVAH